MGLNSVASADRVHIGFFGLRNAGKSSVVNAVTGQALSLVSEVKGTTTDPVKKAMELLPLGPVVIIDTPGIDDEGELGLMRVGKAKQALNYCDIAVLVVDASKGMSQADSELLALFKSRPVGFRFHQISQLLRGVFIGIVGREIAAVIDFRHLHVRQSGVARIEAVDQRLEIFGLVFGELLHRFVVDGQEGFAILLGCQAETSE